MEDVETTTPELNDEQIDQLVAETEESPNREIPMTKEEAAPPQQDQAQTAQEYEFVHNGKTIKAPVDQILKWAQMGYNYPQKAQQLNQQLQQWEQQKQQWESQWGTYRQVDEWAKQNSDQWAKIQESIRTAQEQPQGVQPNDPYQNKFKQLESKLSKTEQFIESQMLEKQQAQRVQEDQKLTQEIQSSQEQYKDLDWQSPDENGKTLEYRVLDHAYRNGIPSFDAAFKHLMHDQLVQRAQNMGKQTVAKNIQQQTRMGVLGKSPTPSKQGVSQAKDISQKSYDDLMREALDELGMGA